jgi:hypothetical protein
LTDGTELVVDVSDRPLDVGDGHDGVLVQSELLIGQFFERSLAGGEAFLHALLGPLSFRDVRPDGNILTRFSIRAHQWDDGRIHPVK